MTESDRIKYLCVALSIVGLIFTFGLWPLTIVQQIWLGVACRRSCRVP